MYDEFTLVHKNELIDEEEALKQLNISFLPSKNDLDIEKFKTKLLSEGFKYQSYGEFALFLNE